MAGCDRLTISPDLLAELAADNGSLTEELKEERATSSDANVELNEDQFRFALNDDAMSTEKLAEGIRKFAADQKLLEDKLLA